MLVDFSTIYFQYANVCVENEYRVVNFSKKKLNSDQTFKINNSGSLEIKMKNIFGEILLAIRGALECRIPY